MPLKIENLILFDEQTAKTCMQVELPYNAKIIELYTYSGENGNSAVITIQYDPTIDKKELRHFHIPLTDTTFYADDIQFLGSFTFDTFLGIPGKYRFMLYEVLSGDWGILSRDFKNTFGEGMEGYINFIMSTMEKENLNINTDDNFDATINNSFTSDNEQKENGLISKSPLCDLTSQDLQEIKRFMIEGDKNE